MPETGVAMLIPPRTRFLPRIFFFFCFFSFPSLFSFARLSLFCEYHEKFRSEKLLWGGGGKKGGKKISLSVETDARSLQLAACLPFLPPWLPLPCLCFASLIIGNNLPPSKLPTPPLLLPPLSSRPRRLLRDLLTYFLQ